MMRWYEFDHGMGAWGWTGMIIGSVLFWGLIIAALVLVARAWRPRTGRRGTAPPTPPPTPERLLAERFARGEIDEEEYRRRQAALSDAVHQHAGTTPGR